MSIWGSLAGATQGGPGNLDQGWEGRYDIDRAATAENHPLLALNTHKEHPGLLFFLLALFHLQPLPHANLLAQGHPGSLQLHGCCCSLFPAVALLCTCILYCKIQCSAAGTCVPKVEPPIQIGSYDSLPEV